MMLSEQIFYSPVFFFRKYKKNNYLKTSSFFL